MANDRVELEIKNFYKIKKILSQMEGNYLGEFFKEAKEIAKPIQAEIIKAIPNKAPIRGMKPVSLRGRLAWGIGKRAKSVTIKARRSIKRGSSFQKGKTNAYPLAQIVAASPALVLADMAGKNNRFTNKRELSRKHEINLFGRGIIVERRYRINRQGIHMISALGGKASRIFWPAAERAWPIALKKMDALVTKLHDKVSKEIGA